MTIFDYLKDIIVTKKGDLPLDQYVPYLVTRWLSFINPIIAEFANALNTKVLLENKELHYKMLIAAIPKAKYAPRITYVKKVKEDEAKEDQRVSFLAQGLEISKREARMLLSH